MEDGSTKLTASFRFRMLINRSNRIITWNPFQKMVLTKLLQKTVLRHLNLEKAKLNARRSNDFPCTLAGNRIQIKSIIVDSEISSLLRIADTNKH